MALNHCPKCGILTSDTATICVKCGADLRSPEQIRLDEMEALKRDAMSNLGSGLKNLGCGCSLLFTLPIALLFFFLMSLFVR